jgi:hypothetical protein
MKATGIAFWASVQAPNTTYEPEWSIDLLVTKEEGKRLKASGLRVKLADPDKYGEEYEGMGVIKIKRKVTRRNGKANQQPRVVDANKTPVEELIGNGSAVNVLFDTYEWTYKQSSGVGADLKAVQVTNLVPYVGKDNDDNEDFDKEEGFTSNNNNNNDEDFDDDVPF